jgi:hypothetical protein
MPVKRGFLNGDASQNVAGEAGGKQLPSLRK